MKSGPVYVDTCAFLLLYGQALLIPWDSCKGKFVHLGSTVMQFCPYLTCTEGQIRRLLEGIFLLSCAVMVMKTEAEFSFWAHSLSLLYEVEINVHI